ncbi:MAG: DUF4863 family protein [Planctomycetes bacterium]|nr:DUF4863 family protein [Planctomycetota bacterium]MBL7007922.1 DUF4863 family protein [Planctomycetota bacterium]
MELTPRDLHPLLAFAATLDLKEPAVAREGLEAEFPFDGPFVQELGRSMREALAGGTICNHGAAPLQYSRLFSESEESAGFSADAVLMSVPGPLHEHPEGEIDLCFAVDGAPRFDGNPPGWTVYEPGSKHAPTVEGGAMLILYLLPDGAIRFLRG